MAIRGKSAVRFSADLARIAGLPVTLHEDGQLSFGADVEIEDAGVRKVRSLCRVALDRPACEAAPDEQPAYFMYNGVIRAGDKATVADWNLRFELTSIPAGRIGRECAKTLGHRHNLRGGSSQRDAEVCEVIHGVAHFLFEFRGQTAGEPSVVYYVEGKTGDKILFPPDTLHLTINPGAETCIFTDVVVRGLSGDYADFQSTQGASYHEICEGGGTLFERNAGYRMVPELRRVQPREYPALGLTKVVPLYTAFLERGPEWRFLKHPEAFWETFGKLKAEIGLQE